MDIRGSTSLAEGMGPEVFAALINRFYHQTTAVLVESGAFIDKFVGDEVMAVYMPVFSGQNHALAAITAAQQLLNATHQDDPGGPALPLGVGVNTGSCYFGTVQGIDGTFADVTALGDPVNVAARLAAAAAAGEALVSESACTAAGTTLVECESRVLALKGKSQGTSVRVLRANSVVASR